MPVIVHGGLASVRISETEEHVFRLDAVDYIGPLYETKPEGAHFSVYVSGVERTLHWSKEAGGAKAAREARATLVDTLATATMPLTRRLSPLASEP